MKFILDENDQKFVDKVNTAFKNNELDGVPLFINEIGTSYYLKFNCTDIGKANAFIFAMMNSNNEQSEEIENKLGIDVTHFCYSNTSHQKLAEVKLVLQDLLNRIDEL